MPCRLSEASKDKNISYRIDDKKKIMAMWWIGLDAI